MTIYERIRRHLADRPYREIEHRPISSAEEAAEVRGTPPQIGGKTILLLVKRRPLLLALPADRALDNRAIKDRFGTTHTRFATAEELAARTGLERGALPPFGAPIFDLPLYVDRTLAEREQIVFTAGRRDRSILMATVDWLALAGDEERFAFSREPV